MIRRGSYSERIIPRPYVRLAQCAVCGRVTASAHLATFDAAHFTKRMAQPYDSWLCERCRNEEKGAKHNGPGI